jgi:hypothetical protein
MLPQLPLLVLSHCGFPGEPLQLDLNGIPTSVYTRPALKRRCPVVGIPRMLVGYAGTCDLTFTEGVRCHCSSLKGHATHVCEIYALHWHHHECC